MPAPLVVGKPYALTRKQNKLGAQNSCRGPNNPDSDIDKGGIECPDKTVGSAGFTYRNGDNVMATPSIAHFGTTIVERAPSAGVAQKDVPLDGILGDMLAFLKILGFTPTIENYYEGIGRQFIWSRGTVDDVDYVEQDNFTSYTAEERPATDKPRVGDTIFRLTHSAPRKVLKQLLDEGLAKPLAGEDAEQYLRGETQWLLLQAPNGQTYQFGETQTAWADNHVVYIWTESARVTDIANNYKKCFGFRRTEDIIFHEVAQALMLRREEPGMSIGLLHRPDEEIASRWSDDIFKEAGYAHFRLGAPDKGVAQAASREAFPAAGDVSFVYFEDSYLELVQN